MMALFDNLAARFRLGSVVAVPAGMKAVPADPLAALRAEHDRIFAERRAARADRKRAAEEGAAAAQARRKPDPIMASRMIASTGQQA